MLKLELVKDFTNLVNQKVDDKLSNKGSTNGSSNND